jgi:hypothetical protein
MTVEIIALIMALTNNCYCTFNVSFWSQTQNTDSIYRCLWLQQSYGYNKHKFKELRTYRVRYNKE